MKTTLCAVIAAAFATPTLAGTDFGTKEEAREIASQVVDIIEAQGLTAAAEAIISSNGPYRKSRMGINLFNGTVVIADNREPESVEMDFGDFPDLTGEPVWPRISAAADIEDDARLLWYHYDTQQNYEFHCFVKRAQRGDSMVMVCR